MSTHFPDISAWENKDVRFGCLNTNVSCYFRCYRPWRTPAYQWHMSQHKPQTCILPDWQLRGMLGWLKWC